MVNTCQPITINPIPNYTTMPHTNSSVARLEQTIKALRGPEGCPWDRRQTTTTMVKYLQSEFAELLEAIENNDLDNLREELGDMLFLIIMISTINDEQGNFSFKQVAEGVTDKLIRRHPHVFAGLKITDEEELRAMWKRIKAEEKSGKFN